MSIHSFLFMFSNERAMCHDRTFQRASKRWRKGEMRHMLMIVVYSVGWMDWQWQQMTFERVAAPIYADA